jgi:Na+/proline symporter
MYVSNLDWSIVIAVLVVTLGIGIYTSRKAGKSSAEFFLSGRTMPWWLLGLSMVATTFSTDTPNFVTNLVREKGVSANWEWWAFLITGMLTVFVYARLWRKSNVKTDMEFYELRYGGKPAKFLRIFRSLYLGIAFNVLAMSGVTLAAIKIGQVMLGLSPLETIGVASVVTVVFSALGGFRGVVYTDFLLFFLAMTGAIGAAYYAVNLPEVGGIEKLLSHPNVAGKISIFPDFSNKEALVSLFIIPLAVQWWSAWFPGSEPGGGGYVAQRMLAAKDEDNAMGATFFFYVLHYAIRPWPWILVALVSLVIYPDLASLAEAFPAVTEDKLGHDLGYSAILTMLPKGLLGVVLASLIAAYISTISTHLNWGSSYIVNDFYAQQINKNATEKELVMVGRISTVVLMILSAIFALYLKDALELFKFIIAFGAGTGLIFILRWFWWRINAWSEISAMICSGVVSILFLEIDLEPAYLEFPIIVLITTIVWIAVTYLTSPEKKEVLRSFYNRVQPGGPGWNKVLKDAVKDNVVLEESGSDWVVPSGIAAMLVATSLIYCILFATGYWIYGQTTIALIITIIAVVLSFFLLKMWKGIRKAIF